MAIVFKFSSKSESGLAAVDGWNLTLGQIPAVDDTIVLALASRIPVAGTPIPAVSISSDATRWSLVRRFASDVGAPDFGVMTDLHIGQPTGGNPPGVVIRISYPSQNTIGVAVAAVYSGISGQAVDVTFGFNGSGTPAKAGPTSVTNKRAALWSAVWSSEDSQNEPSAVTNGFSIVDTTNGTGGGTNPPGSGQLSIGLGERIVVERGRPESDATIVGTERWSSLMASFASADDQPLPSGTQQTSDTGVIKNTDHVGLGLSRLLEQFKSGDD